jgi:hypothetical protein
MTRAELREFARAGAEARLQAIADERVAIIRTFPDLKMRSTAAVGSRDAAVPVGRGARKRRRMSAAERKALGARMRRYWAKRRAEIADATKAAGASKSAGRKRRKGMSDEARKAQAERMRAYWAAKRAQRTNGADGGTQVATANQNGAPSRRSPQKAGRKQGRKK